MKFTIFAAIACVASAQVVDLDNASISVAARFNAFMKQFNKQYTAEETKAAFAAFRANDAKIQDYNSQNLTYTLGHNEFSDMTSEDFNAQMLGGYSRVEKPEADKNYVDIDTLPEVG